MSRNTEGAASPHNRSNGSENVRYGIDEGMRSVVQTAPPYPSILGNRRSPSPVHGTHDDHVRKKPRLDYETGVPSTTSPSIGGYDNLNGSGRGPAPGYANGHPYGYQTQQPPYPYYGQSSYGIPASAPPLRDSYNQHLASTGPNHHEGTFPQASAEFPGVHQSRLSTGSDASPGSQYYARAAQQGNGGYPPYQALSQPSNNAFPAGATVLAPPASIGLSDTPHTPMMNQESRSWSNAYGVPASLSPNANTVLSGISRQTPIARASVEMPATYYSRSYPPYDERSLPPGVTPSPYQQSTPQFVSPEAGPSILRGEASYPSAAMSTTRPTGSTSTSSNNQTAAKSQALFVSKLYNMLEDPEIVASGLLKWSADGLGFICSDPNEFARLFLSKYFKHANWHSFVRQLNMYGFNKQVNDVFQTLSQPADQPVAWEFRHSIFRRGDPSCVQRIKRRSVKSNSTAPRDLASAQIARPPGLPTATTSTSFIYPSTYQAVTYSSDPALQGSHPAMLPRYNAGEPYGLPGGYALSQPGPSGNGPPPGWMPGPQYAGRQGVASHAYQSNAYMPPPSDINQGNSQRSTSSLPTRTTESYTRHDRPGRPY